MNALSIETSIKWADEHAVTHLRMSTRDGKGMEKGPDVSHLMLTKANT